MTPHRRLWLDAPARPTLAEGEVHVWRCRLDREGAELRSLAGLLSPEERARADRYHFQKDRTRFVVARAALRLTLARYLDAEIKAIGEGLSHSLHSFTVSLAGGEPISLSAVGDPGVRRWSLTELLPAEEYRAALAVEGETWTLRCRQVP